ncbi:NINE protein [Corynebacterium qintianiae]|uniref:NINE protein n=1 Tax=Corynebacterium qintianiae TaxID=2709392 RepID=A0A7T0KM18_9CORY|nr:NINE protein [Corynebacterium qintianiae]QPK83002.1 NINE protein [Corynebacterium qintianiae]
MSTRYTGPGGEQFDADGLPLRKPAPYSAGYGTFPTAPPQQFGAQQLYQQFPSPQQQYGAVAQPAYPVAPKSKIVAALLFFFLGGLGVGNFYLHQNKLGAIKLVLSVVGFLTTILLIGFVILGAVGLWALVETVLVLAGAGGYDRDGRGVPLD